MSWLKVLDFTKEPDKPKRGRRPPTPVTIRGVRYASITEAMEAGYTVHRIYKTIKANERRS